MKLCVIPARGGNRRIPRTNIREVCAKPMIARSIEAAQASAGFGQIIVSTDDAEIAEAARHWGVDVPFKRPIELAGDSQALRQSLPMLSSGTRIVPTFLNAT